ncbi:MAG: carbohydrate ABC transporter permease [Lachnospiraceae bacterium]|nr:carbohydrate ABC transporter permease [Lachnospiraceae bacterium]
MMRKKQGIAAGVVKALMWVYSIATFAILLYLVYNSLRSRNDFLSNTFGKPESLGILSYIRLITKDHFFRYFFNSVLILVVSLALLILISSVTAYGIARYTFPLKRLVRVFFLIGMMFPVQLSVVPLFLVMNNMKLVDNPLSVILISSAGISLPVFMLTNFFEKLPKEIYESAIMDGAGEWTTFFLIMFPIASPVVMSVCITTSVSIWNQFFLPLIFLKSDIHKTVPLLVTKYTNNLLRNIDMSLAVSVMSTIPILILFIIFSNRIIEGVTEGAVKG